MNKQKIIIFGCGDFGKKAYRKLANVVNIIGYSDNNGDMWEKEINGVKIFSPQNLNELIKKEKTYVLIAVKKYEEILEQLIYQQVSNILVWKEGFIFRYDNGLIPFTLYTMTAFKKTESEKYSILKLRSIKKPCNHCNINTRVA